MRQLFLILILAIIVFLQINGEKIPVNEGAIGDGEFYRDVGRFFLDNIETASYNLVQLTRILPFALLNLSFSAFHIVKDDEGLKNGMIIWQVVYLALAVYWYFRICKKLRLKTAQMTIGFILLFFNFAWLKSVWYHPFTPDMMAFALGMGQMNYFLRYEKFKLGMVSLLGAFVSPLLLFSGLLMLFLPGDKLPVYPGERPKSSFAAFVALISPILIAIIGWWVWNWRAESVVELVFHGLGLLILAVLIVFAAKQNPIDWDLAIVQLKKKTKVDKLNKGIMVLMGIVLILIMLSGSNESLGVISFLVNSGDGAFRFPADFIISSALHWGLAALFTLVYLNRYLQEMGKLGWGICIIMAMAIIFLPYLKPPTLAAWVPIWIIILVKALRRYQWSKKHLILDGAVALLLSLSWLKLNSDALESYLNSSDPGLKTSFSIQKYLIHFPEYTAFWAYGLSLLILGLATWFFYIRRKKFQRVITV